MTSKYSCANELFRYDRRNPIAIGETFAESEFADVIVIAIRQGCPAHSRAIFGQPGRSGDTTTVPSGKLSTVFVKLTLSCPGSMSQDTKEVDDPMACKCLIS